MQAACYESMLVISNLLPFKICVYFIIIAGYSAKGKRGKGSNVFKTLNGTTCESQCGIQVSVRVNSI